MNPVQAAIAIGLFVVWMLVPKGDDDEEQKPDSRSAQKAAAKRKLTIRELDARLERRCKAIYSLPADGSQIDLRARQLACDAVAEARRAINHLSYCQAPTHWHEFPFYKTRAKAALRLVSSALVYADSTRKSS